MNTLFGHVGQCQSCKEGYEDKLYEIIILGKKFLFCEDCQIGQEDATLEQNLQFINEN